MLFIRNFPCQLGQTEQLALWLNEVSLAIGTISFNKLRFLVHEAFVNACKYSKDSSSNIIVLIRLEEVLEIAVTDSGEGFNIPANLIPSDNRAIGFSWQLAHDRSTGIRARIESPNTLSFFLEEIPVSNHPELLENHRGLISLLKASQKLRYHYVPNSYNYLHITC